MKAWSPAFQRWFCVISLGALLLALPDMGQAQAEHPATGRRIAPVMGMTGADWLDRSDRDSEEAPEKAIAALDLRPGMMVGEVGAGTGFISIRMAKQVAPTGRVYANDIQPQMLAVLRRRAAEQKVTNIETVLGREANPRLPIGKLDLVIMVDVYHELARPQRMLENIRTSLKPDGRLVLLEYRKEDPTVPIRLEHKMSLSEIKAEIVPEGYRFEKAIETLPRQHIVIFRKSLPN